MTRYDGKRCTVFRQIKGDTNSLPHSGINGLSLDPLGRMWVATADGLCWWDCVWCSSWGRGLYLLNEQTGNFDDYDDGPVIATSLLFDRHPDAGQIVWLGGGKYGLF